MKFRVITKKQMTSIHSYLCRIEYLLEQRDTFIETQRMDGVVPENYVHIKGVLEMLNSMAFDMRTLIHNADNEDLFDQNESAI